MQEIHTSGCSFYIVRHGQTEWNAKGKLQGHTDIPLNEVGKAEAQSLQQEFHHLSFAAAYSSDLQRAYETAQIICYDKDIEVQPCQWLRERYYGPLEGTTQDERRMMYESDTTNSQVQSLVEYLVARFHPEMETAQHAYLRVIEKLKLLAHKHEGKRVLIVTHAGILRYILNPKLPSNDEHWGIQNCGWIKLHIQNHICTILERKGIALKPKQIASVSSIP